MRPRWWWTAGALVLIASIVAEIVAHDESHVLFWWHAVPGFDFLLGAIGAAAIVVVAKALGSIWLKRPEDYYIRIVGGEPRQAAGEEHS